MNWRLTSWKLMPRVLVQVIPIAAIVLVAAWYVAERTTHETVAEEVAQRLHLNASKRADEIAYQLTTLRRAAHSLAINDLIINGLVDEETQTSYLPAFVRSYVAPGPKGAKLSLLDYRGRFIASNDRTENYVNAPWLAQVMSGERVFTIDTNGLLIAEPVRYQGSAEGVIVLRYQAENLDDLVIATKDSPLVMFGRSNVLLHAWTASDSELEPMALLTDPRWLHATVTLPDHENFRIVAFTKREQSHAALNSIQLAAEINIGVSLVALLGGIWWAAYLAMRPVSRISSELAGMGHSGDLSRRLTETDSAEFRALAQSFNHLLARLQESTTSRESLQIEVRERTAAQIALQNKASELEVLTQDLRRSNQELERFAYIASHDLQEPLRMVGSYTQLLKRRYGGQLDDDADEYIEFAVDGAKRMQALLNDLLQYSRVGSSDKELQTTDTATVVAAARDNLCRMIEDTGAQVIIDIDLPIVHGEEVQLIQLFQNLIANAIKFHGESSPRVSVSATRQDDGYWRFAVRDNGIGISAEYNEKIFEVFQRLHGIDQYPGTGIGLAVCKRVVECHGGKIWVESNPGHGANFYFTLQSAEADTREAANPHVARERESLAQHAGLQ